jgi:hypothetical protein
VTLDELASCFQQLTFYGSKKKCLCTVAEICVAYPKPMLMLGKFRDAYKLMAKIAEDAKAGRRCELAAGREAEAESFLQNLRRFTNITGLREMRRNACMSMKGGFSTCKIDFPTWEQVERLIVGAGPQCALKNVESS